jgi:hypothetical protein
MPIDIERGLPSLTALTPIHTHLAVQYQMCIIAQLPHVMLLAKQYGSKHQQVYGSVFKNDKEGGKQSSIRDGPARRDSGLPTFRPKGA